MNPLRTLRHLPRRLAEAEIPLLSASLAFSTLLCLIPFLAIGFAVLQKVIGFESLAAEAEAYVLGFFKSTAGHEASAMLKKVLSRLSKRSWTATSAVVLFLTSFKMFLDLELAVNRVWFSRNGRSLWQRLTTVFGFYVLVPVGLAVYLGLRSANMLQPVFSWHPAAWDIALSFAVLLVVNRWLPAVKVNWLPALIGASISAAGLAVLGGSFKWLTVQVFNYSKIYGSLAALPLFCLWILLAWQIVLAGIAVASGLQNPVGRKGT